MNNTSRYTGWSSNSNISYGDYLQGKEFERSIRYGIEDQTKEIIASNEQLSRENIQVLGQVNDSIGVGFTNLSMDVDTLRGDLQNLSATFEWGFSEVLISLGRVGDSLDALIKLAKSPAQTWAYEQFEIARDEFRRGLYHESLESVTKAINGYGSNPGYKTEFRFHFLQGTILLGSFKNSDTKLVNPAEAEESFLKAARYAASDMPLEAAQSFLCAGRAAFVQKKAEDALKYSSSAISLNPKLVEAYFQSTQALCVLGRPEEGLTHLVTAIADEHEYSIKAASDADIYQHSEMLKKALVLAKDKHKEVYELDKKSFETKIDEIRNTEIDGYAVKTICSEQFVDASKYEKEFELEASKDTIFGYVQASRLARKSDDVIRPIVTFFESASSKLIDDEKLKLQQKISNINSTINEARNVIAGIAESTNRSEPKKFSDDWVDILLCAPIAMLIFLWIMPKDNSTPLWVQFLFYAFIGFISMIPPFSWLMIPFAFIIHSIRKLSWESSANDAESVKNQFKSEIDSKNENLKKLDEKLTELQAIRSRIENFKKQVENKLIVENICSNGKNGV